MGFYNTFDIDAYIMSFIFEYKVLSNRKVGFPENVDIKSNIAIIDFMVDRLHVKKYINEKQVYKPGIDLIEINKMVTRWLNNKL